MRTGGFTDEFADRLTDGISEKSRRFRYFVAYAGLLALFAVFFIWNINAGSVDISVKEIFSILFLGGGDETQSDIIRQIRLPRITAAAVLGGALALAGFLLQTFFRNPIAGPFVLGISSGAEMVMDCLCSIICTKLAASTKLSIVPVSSQAKPRPSSCTSRAP